MNVLQMSLSAAALIIVIVVIRTFIIHKLPKKTFLVLWGVVVFRLLVPVYVPLPLGVHTLTGRSIELVSMVSVPTAIPVFFMEVDDIVGVDNFNTLASMPSVEKIPQPPLLAIIWFIGMIALAMFFVISHWRSRKVYMASTPIENDYIKNWLQKLKLKRFIQIRQSDRIISPITHGVCRPVILFPKIIDWHDEVLLRYILTHELTHIRRFDVLAKWLLAFTLCVHWFNPLVWVMYILANRDIEVACDEKVIKTFGETSKSTYVSALIGLEESKSGLSLLCNNFAKNAIEERIKIIMKMKKHSIFGTIIAAVLVSVITLGSLAVNAQRPAGESPPFCYEKYTKDCTFLVDVSGMFEISLISVPVVSLDDFAFAPAIMAEMHGAEEGDIINVPINNDIEWFDSYVEAQSQARMVTSDNLMPMGKLEQIRGFITATDLDLLRNGAAGTIISILLDPAYQTLECYAEMVVPFSSCGGHYRTGSSTTRDLSITPLFNSAGVRVGTRFSCAGYTIQWRRDCSVCGLISWTDIRGSCGHSFIHMYI